MKNLKKKAFTLVELLVVIAIIAILAVAGVVGYVVFTKKAAQSNDTSLVSQLNEYMAAASSTDNIDTVTDARNLLIEDGIDLATLKLTAKGYRAAFDVAGKKFYKIDGTKVDGSFDGNKSGLFVFVKTLEDANTYINAGYAVYLQAGFNSTEITATAVGIDVGQNSFATVNYNGNASSNNVVVRTYGDQCVLNINAPNDDVQFYGFAKTVNVTDIKMTSLHIYGAVNELAVAKGHVEVEETGIVFDVTQIGTVAEGSGASITNEGFIAKTTLTKHTTEAAKTAAAATVTGEVGGDYKIGNLAQMEAFRDAVNAGNSFAGLTVKLTNDITLNDGWKPIGEGYRDVANTNTAAYGITTFFAGIFDGNNKTISNLNNKGFVPTQARLVKDDGVDTYAYGLFALVENATFKNVKLTNVDIDGSRYAGANIDSVGALVGYSRGNLTVQNITVSGAIKGTDAVSGVVGRINLGANTVLISGCSNSANITAEVVASGIARIYKGAAGHSCTLINNANTGTITSTHATKPYYGGICVYTQTKTNPMTTSTKNIITLSTQDNLLISHHFLY